MKDFLNIERIKSELASAFEFNQRFFRNLKRIKGNLYAHSNGQKFEITEVDGKRQMTRYIDPDEKAEIEKSWPPSGN
jgi:hypothetical protein